MSYSFNEQDYLLSSQYKSADKLKARIALHEKYGQGKIDFHRWLFEHIDIKDDARVLELGTGSARVWLQNRTRIPQAWDITLSDFSEGMLAEAKNNLADIDHEFEFRQIDIQNIPFADDSFDMLMANHMLYHVPDIDKAISEVKRVLKPKGKFYAAANAKGNMLELRQMLNDISKFFPNDVVVNLNNIPYTLDLAPSYLEKYFDNIERFNLNSQIIVDKAKPIMDYLISMIDLDKLENLVSQQEQEQSLEQALAYINKKLANGAMVIDTKTGMTVAY